jgi:basic amino acid/polyamine antiporter, APA family
METWIRLVVWLLVGLLIYFFYGRFNSRVQKALPPIPSE